MNDNSTLPACPVCGKPAQPKFKPFCSTRCADVDLHRWLSESYRVPAVEDPEGLPEDE
ncbi:MAG: DNA gyrase inhibitor YacG [Magnetospirillum sp.]|nr:DNA gyrase inhibitor YacG [Magnetospirillum sp.]